MKNRISELERQIIEKDAVINFLSNQLLNKNLNGGSSVNKTVNDHNSFQEWVDNIVNNNLPLWSNGMIIIRKKDIIGDSMLNNINSCGLSKSNKVSVSNFPGATSEDILDEIEDTLKTHPDTRSFMQEQMTLRRTSIRKEASKNYAKKQKESH